eukprot:GHUV01039399.1.p1 GENE.GHUV01039399.1~~GHUV01039399.1.p1  ORF type:complete len:187 (+),score=93.06 GHUV01039399.1:482-1042(+)
MFTPNGRFAVNTKLCLSITDYHPESWNPMWSVGTILTGLLSFMYDKQPTTGSITTSTAEKQRLARESLAFNAKNATFRKLFPDWVEQHNKRLEAAAAAAAQQQKQQAAAEDQPRQPQQGTQQQQPGVVPGAQAAAGNHDNKGNSLFTVAMVVTVLAIAVVPLFSTDAKISFAQLARLRDLAMGSSS